MSKARSKHAFASAFLPKNSSDQPSIPAPGPIVSLPTARIGLIL
ncbi:hypothetical protein [Pedobacter nototheniae]|nr:hypothetical protein [Pedobacter nototheniae]